MNTPAISNPISVLPAQLPKTQQAGAGAAASPFNQILSREVADRHSASEPTDASKPSPKEAAGATAPNQPPSSEKTVEKNEGTEVESTTAPVLNTADAMSVQILALAVQFALANAAPPEAAASTAVLPDDAAGSAIGAGKENAATAAWLPQLVDNQRGADAKGNDAQRAASGFDTLMDETRDPKQALDLTQLKLQETQSAPTAAALAVAPLQPAIIDKAQLSAAHPMEKLTPSVGTPGWDQALGQKVVWMVAGAQQTASLTLNPPDLGPLQVVLNVSNSQATANFFAAQPEVRQALEAAMPKLREMLGDAGIQLGQANVSAGAPNQNQQGGSGEQRQTSRRADQGGNGEVVDTPLTASRSVLPVARQGMVDTFV